MTTTTDTLTPLDPSEVYVLERDAGAHRHFLNVLATIKLTAGETGSMSAVEFVQPKGFGPPLHCHRDEDEIVIVLDGEVAFRSGDAEVVAGNGAYINHPHGIHHTLNVMSDTARNQSRTAAADTTPMFDRMVDTLGAPIESATLPEPVDIDPGHVAEVNGRLGIDILGPPPAPLPE